MNFRELIVKNIDIANQTYTDSDGITQAFAPMEIYLVPRLDHFHERYVLDKNGILSKGYTGLSGNYIVSLDNASSLGFTGGSVSALPYIKHSGGTDVQITTLNYVNTNFYNKGEIDAKLSAVYRPKGSVPTFADLPTSGNTEGDVWNVIDTGSNYVWVLNLNNTGLPGWDKLSETVDLSNYYTKPEVDTLLTHYVDKTTAQTITGIKSYATAGGNAFSDNTLHVYSSDGSNPAITFNKIGVLAGQLKMHSSGFSFTNASGTDFMNVYAEGYTKNNSSDSFVLTGGGGHKAISDFALSSSLGNYVPITGNASIQGIKTFTGVYTQWILNGDSTTNASGFVQSDPASFNIGTLNNKNVAFYRNSSIKVLIEDNQTSFAHNVQADTWVASSEIAIGQKVGTLRITKQTPDIIGGLSESNGWAYFKGTGFIADGGTSSQFLKADGTLDSNTYALSSSLGNYLPLAGGILTGGGIVQDNGTITLQQTGVGGNATGLFWYKIDDSERASGIGTFTQDGVVQYTYMGWGITPWDLSTSLSVSDSFLKYKTNDIWHSGNFNPSNYVPYTGATTNIDINSKNLTTTGLIKSSEFQGNIFSSTVMAGSQVFNANNANALIIGNDTVPNLYYGALSGHSWDVNGNQVGNMTASGLGITGNIWVNGSQVLIEAHKGVANGVAPLGSDSKISSAYLPSYVDDVLEFANLAAFPATGEAGKIYVALDTNLTYRWGGSSYTQIAAGAVQSVNGQTGVVNITKTDVGLSNVDNTADATKNVLSASKWANTRTLSYSGDVTGSNTVDGSGNVNFGMTLANTGITPGTYNAITFDAKGRATAGTTESYVRDDEGFLVLEKLMIIDDTPEFLDSPVLKKWNVIFDASAEGEVTLTLYNNQYYQLSNTVSVGTTKLIVIVGGSTVDTIDPGVTKLYVSYGSGKLLLLSMTDNTQII